MKALIRVRAPARIDDDVSNPVLDRRPLFRRPPFGVKAPAPLPAALAPGCPPSITAVPCLSVALDQFRLRIASFLPAPGIILSIVGTNTETGILVNFSGDVKWTSTWFIAPPVLLTGYSVPFTQKRVIPSVRVPTLISWKRTL